MLCLHRLLCACNKLIIFDTTPMWKPSHYFPPKWWFDGDNLVYNRGLWSFFVFFLNSLKIPTVASNKHMHITVHIAHTYTNTHIYAYAFYACFVSCQDVEVKESKQVQRPTVTTVMETPSMGDGGDQVWHSYLMIVLGNVSVSRLCPKYVTCLPTKDQPKRFTLSQKSVLKHTKIPDVQQ